jgi:hypothetical protein
VERVTTSLPERLGLLGEHISSLSRDTAALKGLATDSGAKVEVTSAMLRKYFKGLGKLSGHPKDGVAAPADAGGPSRRPDWNQDVSLSEGGVISGFALRIT